MLAEAKAKVLELHTMCFTHHLGAGMFAGISSLESSEVVNVMYLFRVSKTIMCYLKYKTQTT